MIKLENLSKSFGDNLVIDNLNVDFSDNQITCVLSASGAGKTTMLRIISGLEKDYLGKAVGAGKVSVTFQEDRLFDWLTALQNIEIVSDSKTAKKLLEQMGLSAQADKYPNQLSGGMRRRISLARSLAVQSDTLILDEPLKGLDVALKQSVYSLILDYSKGKTVIMTTHDVIDAVNIADRILYFSANGFKIEKDIAFEIPPKQRDEKIINKYMEQIME